MNSLTPQQAEILELLRAAGTEGINSFGRAREIALQLPAVIAQLQEKGYIIHSVRRTNRSANYVLLHTPEELRKAPEVIARPQGWEAETQSIEDASENLVTLEEIEEKLQTLRDEYRTATESRRKTIQLMARALVSARSEHYRRQEKIERRVPDAA